MVRGADVPREQPRRWAFPLAAWHWHGIGRDGKEAMALFLLHSDRPHQAHCLDSHCVVSCEVVHLRQPTTVTTSSCVLLLLDGRSSLKSLKRQKVMKFFEEEREQLFEFV